MKTRIDKIRDSAGSMEINFDGDLGEIAWIVSFSDRMLVVKDFGVYEVTLADQIDPERTNESIPNTFQRIVAFGSSQEWIAKTLLTADRLLGKGNIEARVDKNKGMVLVLEITKILGEMKEGLERFRAEELQVGSNFIASSPIGRSIPLPSIAGADVRARLFVQKVNHVLQHLFDLAKLFYEKLGAGGWGNLIQLAKDEKTNDNFVPFLESVKAPLLLLRNMRNAIEHERPEMKLIVRDFSLNSSNQLVPPSLKLIHPKTPLAEASVSAFMRAVFDRVVETAEMMLAFLCSRRIVSGTRIPMILIELPLGHRPHKDVKFGYAVQLNGKILPLS